MFFPWLLFGCQGIKMHRLSLPLNPTLGIATLSPDRRHTTPKIQVQETGAVGTPLQAVTAECRRYVPVIQNKLEELEEQTFTGRLRTDENSQVPKGYVRVTDRTDVLQNKPCF